MSETPKLPEPAMANAKRSTPERVREESIKFQDWVMRTPVETRDKFGPHARPEIAYAWQAWYRRAEEADARLAEAERLRDRAIKAFNGAQAVAEEIEAKLDVSEKRATEAERLLAEARADAGRYRFLRDIKCNSFTLGQDEDHACNYMTAADWISNHPDWYDHVPADEVERMRGGGHIWNLQVYPDTPIGFNKWSGSTLDFVVDAARDFLVQEFMEAAPAFARLSVNRTTLDGDRWSENITWDELQRIKAECGYRLADAVEVFPADPDVVNVANMRHLWVLREPLPFAWRKQQAGSDEKKPAEAGLDRGEAN